MGDTSVEYTLLLSVLMLSVDRADPNTSTQIQINKYKYTNTKTQIQIHKYKYKKMQTHMLGVEKFDCDQVIVETAPRG